MTEKLNDPMKENNKNEPVGSWRKTLLGEDVTIKQVISNLSESAFQISLIVSQEGTLWNPYRWGYQTRTVARLKH
jgi:hypothetical protein